MRIAARAGAQTINAISNGAIAAMASGAAWLAGRGMISDCADRD